MTNQTNRSPIALSLDAIRSGKDKTESGLASLTAAIIDAWDVDLYWSYGHGDNVTRGVTRLSDSGKPRYHADGSKDKKYRSALFLAIAETFGIDEMTNNDKVSWNNAFAAAAGIQQLNHEATKVQLADGVEPEKVKPVATIKAGKISVPLGVAFDLAGDDGKPTQVAKDITDGLQSVAALDGKELKPEQIEARLAKMHVTCDGAKHKLYGKTPSTTDIAKKLGKVAIAGGLLPEPESRKPRADKGKSVSFDDALGAVITAMEQFNAEGDEGSDVAPTEAQEGKLNELAEAIAFYFINNPPE